MITKQVNIYEYINRKTDGQRPGYSESHGIPYMEELTEKLQRIYCKYMYHIHAVMKPRQTLQNLLVHPKDKRDINQTCGVVYEVCKECDKSYVVRSEDLLVLDSIKEHQEDAEKVENKEYTRTNRKESTSDLNKSAITDHIALDNHVISWDDPKSWTNILTKWYERLAWLERPSGLGEEGTKLSIVMSKVILSITHTIHC